MIISEEKRLGARALAGAAVAFLCGTVLVSDALAGGRIGGTGFGGARIGAPGVGAGGYGGLGTRPAPSSVIRATARSTMNPLAIPSREIFMRSSSRRITSPSIVTPW